VTPSRGVVLVIGGSGFIGRPLVEALRRTGHSVRAMGQAAPAAPRQDWVTGDVRDRDALRQAMADARCVYNLAAAHGVGTFANEVYEAVNVEGAERVCEAATQAGVSRIVFTSTADVYGRGSPFDEDAPTRPQSPYGRSKLAAEEVYRRWAGHSGHSVAIVRPTVVFGPGDTGAVARFLRYAAGPTFTHVGRAQNIRSLAYVENLAAFLAFLRAQTPDAAATVTYNYADRPDLTVAEIAAIVRDAVGLPPAGHRWFMDFARAIVRGSLRGIASQLRLERRLIASRAHETGFVPPYDVREALAATARADVAWVALLSKARA
jgi:nucleoside-diphosphate-sugar epimerase